MKRNRKKTRKRKSKAELIKQRLNKHFLWWAPPVALLILAGFFFLLDTMKARSKASTSSESSSTAFDFYAALKNESAFNKALNFFFPSVRLPPDMHTENTLPELVPDPVPTVTVDPPSPSTVSLKRASIRYAYGSNRNVIYGTNYGSLDALIAPDCKSDTLVPMLDLRAHLKNGGYWATNVGIIGRYIPSGKHTVFGINLYYDFRQGNFGNYNGLGAGFETLGRRWDFRLNGYLPVGTRNHSDVRCNTIPPFFICQRRNLFANAGLNAEVGYNALITSKATKEEQGLVYIAAGPYYFRARGTHVVGGELRIRPQYKDFIALEFLGSYDNHIHAFGQIQLILSLPLYSMGSRKDKANNCSTTKRIFFKPVDRFEIMQLRKSTEFLTNF